MPPAHLATTATHQYDNAWLRHKSTENYCKFNNAN